MSINGRATGENHPSHTFGRKVKSVVALAVLTGAALTLTTHPLQAQAFQSEPLIAGYRNFSYGGGGVTSEPTETKPESKIWYNDGFWWGVLWDLNSETFRIHRFDPATQNWTNTGPEVDDRNKSAADALVDGNKIYISSRAKLNVSSNDSEIATLSRYSYNSGSNSYSLDSGFPVNITGTLKTDALTITKDSAGKIWAAWTKGNNVWVNHTDGISDANWGIGWILPVQGNSLGTTDLSAIAAFSGNKVGVLWSNQIDEKIYFAVHNDASAPGVWQARETVLSGNGSADDHINLAVRPSDGTVLAISKTSFNGTGATLAMLNKRTPAGTWSNHAVWTTAEDPTRPIVVFNASTDSIYAISRLKDYDAVYYKSAHISNPTFSSGPGQILIMGPDEDTVNNTTSAKVALTNASGMLIQASDKGPDFYMHGFVDFNNTRPTVLANTAFTNELSPVTVDVLFGATDPDGTIDPATVQVVISATNGTTSINASTGAITYLPNPGFSGSDEFYFTVSDDDGANAVGKIVTVTVNDSPVAADDTVQTTEDVAIAIDVLANDIDSDGSINLASVVVVTPASNGITTVSTVTGEVTYTPNLNFTGLDTFIYTVADDSGGVSNQATVSVTVSELNDPPFAINDTVLTNNQAISVIDVLSNDFDVDGTLNVSSVLLQSTPSKGTATVSNVTGEITFTPNTGTFGTDSFTYTVDDNLGATSNTATVLLQINAKPIAVDDSATTQKNTAITVDVLNNDSDADGTLVTSTVSVGTLPSHGSFTVNSSTGAITYTPSFAYMGLDSLTYTVQDDSGLTTNVATVHLRVNMVPVAVNDLPQTLKGVAVDFSILDNDDDQDGTLDTASIAVTFGPFNGSLAINSTTGVVTYTPNSLFSGIDLFGYTVDDNDGASSNEANVNIAVDVAPVANNDAATTNEDTPVSVDVVANDTDEDGTIDPVTVLVVSAPDSGVTSVNPTTGVVTYTPNLNYYGSDSFSYTVNDDDGITSNTALVALTVNAVNDAPVALNDTASTIEDTPVSINVAANDSDVDGSLTISLLAISTPPANGTTSVQGTTGFVTYTPGQDYSGSDFFTYTLTDDDNGTSNVATVTIDVSGFNDPPTAVNDTVTTDEEIAITIDVAANDIDLDGVVVPSTVAEAVAPLHGLTSINGTTGEVTYTPDLNFFGADSFKYTIQDDGGDFSNQGVVFITVNPINDPPVAVDDTASTLLDVPVDVAVTANDYDVDGTINPLSILAGSGSHGTTAIKPNGVITYTPGSGYLGSDQFFYTVRDDMGAVSNTGTVTVNTFLAAPVAVNDTVITDEDLPVAIDVTANDTAFNTSIDPATVSLASTPSSGTISVNPTTGVVTYSPNTNFFGQDSFSYSVSDSNGVTSNIAIVLVNVNKTPFALNDNATTDEDVPVDIDVIANDVDPDGAIDGSTVTLITLTANGTTSVHPVTGVVTYTPNTNFSGSDGFTYTVNDNVGSTTNIASVSITISPVNDVPLAVNDTVSVSKNTVIAIDVAANDSDVDGTLVLSSVSVVTQPVNGTANVNPSTGIVTYTPTPFYIGSDSLTYTIDDNLGGTSNVATVLITVTGNNEFPVAVNDTVNTTEDTPTNISVLANDYDLDGTLDSTSVVILANPQNGNASVNPVTGVVTYTPNLDFFGNDSLQYTMKDKQGAISNAAKVLIAIDSSNDSPVAVDDEATMNEDNAAIVDVAANDSDEDGTLDLSSVAVTTGPGHGSITINSTTGAITYTPNVNYFGLDSLFYTIDDNLGFTSNIARVLLTIVSVNDPPVAVNDTVQTMFNMAVTIVVAANDFDVDGTLDTTSVSVGFTANGTTLVKPNGDVTYTPNNGYVGTDSFSYTILDNLGSLSNNGTVVVQVTSAPFVTADFDTTSEDTAKIVNVLSNDNDPDGTIDATTVAVVVQPNNGTTSVNPTTGTITYAPIANFFGQDTFTYTVDDNDGNTSQQALVTMTITPVNDPPVAVNDTTVTSEDTPVIINVVANDSDLDNSINAATVTLMSQPVNGSTTVNGSTGEITYTPNLDYNGLDSLSYHVADALGAVSNTAVVFVTVTSQNDFPVAVDDTVTTDEDIPVVMQILSNDTDPDGSLVPSSVSITSGPQNGAATVNGSTGEINYTPATDYTGLDSLVYTVKDNLGATSNAATVRITVTPINDPPVAVNDTSVTSEDTPVLVDVVVNDTDVDGSVDPATVTLVSQPVNGMAGVNGSTGVITYTPDINFNGPDSLTYNVADDVGAVSNVAKVVLTVSSQNDLPVAVDDTVSTDEDTPISIAVLNNDSDPEGALVASSVTITGGPENGAASVNSATGEIDYAPALDFFGNDSLTYTVDDILGGTSNQAAVRIDVTAVNDAPVALADNATSLQGIAVNINVAVNDTDVDGTINPATIQIASAPQNGGVVISGSPGVIAYTSNPGFVGADTFTYTIKDNVGAVSNSAAVTVTVVAPASYTFQATDDGQIKLTEPTSNYGSKSTFKIENGKFESYFKFNASGISGNIVSATLRLHVTDGSADGGVTGGTLYQASNNFSNSSQPWVETTLVGNNAPATVGSILVTQGAVFPNGVVDFDVTGVLTGNGVYSFCLSNTTGDRVKYYAREGLLPPEIIVETDAGGGSNQPPVANNDIATTGAATAIAIDVTANDTDSDGTIIVSTVAILSLPANGVVAVNGLTGVVTYTPNSGFSGADTFIYTVNDDQGATSNAATVTVTVGAGNTAPVANNDNGVTTAGTSVAIDVTANDSDSDGTIVVSTVTIQTQPSNGSAVVSGVTGVVTYTPNSGFNATDTFTYTVKDNLGALSNVATVTVVVTGGGSGQTLSFQSIHDGQVKLTDVGKNYGSKSTMKVEDGSFASYMKFAVSGLSGSVQSAKVRLQVTDQASDGGPAGGEIYAVSNNFSTGGGAWIESVLTSGNAPNAISGVLSSLGAVSPNQVVELDVTSTVSGDGTYSFALFGTNTNQVKYYTKEGLTPPELIIQISGGGGNTAPVANNDAASTSAITAVAIDVTANDTDIDGTINPASVAIQSPATNGVTTVNGTTGIVTYTPNSGFSGADVFTYTVNDNLGAASNVATVTVTVTAGNIPPVANNDNASTTVASAVVIDVPANDTDSDGTIDVTTVAIQSLPANGSAAVNALSGVITYTPNSGFTGQDTLKYTVNDNQGAASNVASAFIAVGSGNAAPVANNDNAATGADAAVAIDVTANDTDSDGTINVTSVAIQAQATNGVAVASVTTGVVTYTPNSGFSGTDIFTYTVNDNLGATSNAATVTVEVSPANVAPVANDDSGSTTLATAVTVDVTANDTDSDGTINVTTVQIQTAPLNGTAVPNGTTGVVTYTPNSGFSGTDVFTYTVNDDDGATSNVATVTLTVSSGGGGQTVTFVPSDDGQVKLTDNGKNYSTKPTMKLENGAFSSYLKFVVSGISGTISSAVVRLQVSDGSSDGGPTGGQIFLASNNFSNGAAPWVESSLTSGNAPNTTSGVLSSLGAVSPNQLVEFDVTSAVGGDGTYSFCLSSTSGNQVKYYTKEGLVQPTLIVQTNGGGGGGNSTPVAVNDNASTAPGSAVAIDVTANDTDSDGMINVTTVAVQSPAANGTTTVSNSTGIVTYVPNTGFSGTDTFTYTVKDDLGATSNVATVTVAVTSGNVAPVAVNDNASTVSGSAVAIDVTANDTDSDGTINVATVLVVAQPGNGSASVSGVTGVITYTPSSGFSGTDTFTYNVKDNLGAVSNNATVTVTVSGGGGSQTLTFQSTDDNQVKVTEPGSNYGAKETAKVEAAKFSAYYKFVVTGVSGAVQSAKLRLSVTNSSSDGGNVYSVSNNYSGSSSLWTEDVLTAGNAPDITGSPVGNLGQVTAGTFAEVDVTGAVSGNGIFSFAVSKNTSDRAIYHNKEGGNPPELIVTIGSGGGGGGNTPPVAVNDNAATAAATAVAIDVTANDSDSDGSINVTTVSIIAAPTDGAAIVSGATGVVTYTSDSGFSGVDSFTYTVKDNDGATSNVATVTITVSGGGQPATFTFNPIDDSFVRFEKPTNNYGTGTELRIRKSSGSENNSYLRFNVSGLTGPVQSATLRLYCFDGSNVGGSVYTVSNNYDNSANPWQENGVVWDNSPSINGVPLGSFGVVAAGSYFEVDVTAAISGNGTYNFGIGDGSSDAAKFDSDEGSNRPELVINTGTTSASRGEEVLLAKAEVEEYEMLPETASLRPNYPNPFNASTNIQYELPEDANVKLLIYNVRGQLVRSLVDGKVSAGFKKTIWDGRDDKRLDVASGVYFIRLGIGEQKFSRRIVLQK